MDYTDLLIRYLYLGTNLPFHICKRRPLDVAEGIRILEPIQRVMNDDANSDNNRRTVWTLYREAPAITVAQVMTSGTLVRHDECLFTLVFLARTLVRENEKHEIYQGLPELIKTSKDLFLLVSFYKALASEQAQSTGFGTGMKKCIRNWYNKFSAEELAKLLAEDRSWYGWSHKDILKMVRLNIADQDKMQVFDAACGGKGRQKKPKQNEAPKATDSEALEIYKRIKAFKQLTTAAEVVKGISLYGYPLQLVPSPLHRAPEVWEKVLPDMPYREVVQAALVLQDYKLLREDGTVTIAYGRKLNLMQSVTDSKISPIFVYQMMRLFEERQRYLNVVKESIHRSKNLALKKIKPNTTVMNQFYCALNQSLLNYQATNKKILVTLDLRSKQSHKRVFNNRLMSCQAAYILLTLPLIKKERNIKVVSFTGQKQVLVPVDLSTEMDFFRACDFIQRNAHQKTKAILSQPYEYATKNNIHVDVFITIVDSVIRVNPSRESPSPCLDVYNKTMGMNARNIIINLSRHKQDINTENSSGMVLELAGCSEDTLKLIHAFIERRFT